MGLRLAVQSMEGMMRITLHTLALLMGNMSSSVSRMQLTPKISSRRLGVGAPASSVLNETSNQAAMCCWQELPKMRRWKALKDAMAKKVNEPTPDPHPEKLEWFTKR